MSFHPGLFLSNSKGISLRIDIGTGGPQKLSVTPLLGRDFFNEWFQSFTIVSWNERLEGDFWKRPEVWRRHDAHIPRKRPHFKNGLKFSMCSSALHSRSNFPFLPKSSHPHGNFPNTRSFYYFVSLLYFLWWLIATGFRLLAAYDKLSENKRPKLWRPKGIPCLHSFGDSSLVSPSLSPLASGSVKPLRACLHGYVWGPRRGP